MTYYVHVGWKITMNITQERNCKYIILLNIHICLVPRLTDLSTVCNIEKLGMGLGTRLINAHACHMIRVVWHLLSSYMYMYSGRYNAQMTAKRWMKQNLHGNNSKSESALINFSEIVRKLHVHGTLVLFIAMCLHVVFLHQLLYTISTYQHKLSHDRVM